MSLCKDQPNTPLLDLMKKSGAQEVRRVLGDYVHQLKSEFSQGMILPAAHGPKLPQPQTKQKQVCTSKTQVLNGHAKYSASDPESDSKVTSDL